MRVCFSTRKEVYKELRVGITINAYLYYNYNNLCHCINRILFIIPLENQLGSYKLLDIGQFMDYNYYYHDFSQPTPPPLEHEVYRFLMMK